MGLKDRLRKYKENRAATKQQKQFKKAKSKLYTRAKMKKEKGQDKEKARLDKMKADIYKQEKDKQLKKKWKKEAKLKAKHGKAAPIHKLMQKNKKKKSSMTRRRLRKGRRTHTPRAPKKKEYNPFGDMPKRGGGGLW